MPAHGATERRIRLRSKEFEAAATAAGLANDTQIARALRFNQSTISRIRRGVTTPGEAFIAAALETFQVPFEDLFEVTSDAA